VTAPEATLMTEAELAELFLEQIEAEPVSTPSVDRASVLLGLIEEQDLDPERLAELSAAGIAGLYIPEEDRVIVVERDLPKAFHSYYELDRQMILLHEYIHAIQDRAEGLDDLLSEDLTTDAWLGAVSLVEGEATMYHLLTTFALTGHDIETYDVDGELADLVEGMSLAAWASPSPLLTARGTFPYSYGARYAYRNWKKHGASGFAKLYEALPATEQVIYEGEKLGSTPDHEEFDPPAPNTPDGYELVEEDSLGPWFQLGYWGFWLDYDRAEELMLGWRGDRLWFYENAENATVAAVWTIQFDASVNVAALSGFPLSSPPSSGYWGGSLDGHELTLIVTDDANLLLDWAP
jgi:hypothetical protein